MYAALWHALPGPWWVRVIILALLAAAIVFALFTWVFPWIDGFLSAGQEGTVGT